MGEALQGSEALTWFTLGILASVELSGLRGADLLNGPDYCLSLSSFWVLLECEYLHLAKRARGVSGKPGADVVNARSKSKVTRISGSSLGCELKEWRE